jgi:putative heme-binding domain-containing protein
MPNPLTILGILVIDPQPLVRLEAVVACSYINDPHAVEVAMLATDQPLEPPIEYALTQTVNALKPVWLEAQRRGSLSFGGSVQRAAAFARIDGSADSVKDAVARFRRRAEVALDKRTLEGLLASIASAGTPADLALLLPADSYRVGSEYDPAMHYRILSKLQSVCRIRKVTPAGDLAAALKPLIDNPGPADERATNIALVSGEALRLAGLWKLESLKPAIISIASSTQSPPLERNAAFAALAGYNDSASLDALRSAASSGTQSEAAEAIAQLATVNSAVAAKFAAAWFSRGGSVAAEGELFRAFLSSSAALKNLRLAFEARPPSVSSAQTGLRVLAAAGRNDPELVALLFKTAGLVQTAKSMSAIDMPKFIAEVRKSGDPRRGAEIFARPQLNCGACHATGPAPEGIGPNLSALGTAQTPEFIIGAILQPQKEIKEGFMAQAVTMKNGDEVQGYRIRETESELLLRDVVSRKEVALARADIADRRQLGSLMPDGLADSLTWEEFRDLVRFLMSLGRK